MDFERSLPIEKDQSNKFEPFITHEEMVETMIKYTKFQMTRDINNNAKKFMLDRELSILRFTR